jgi:hypothetical protein
VCIYVSVPESKAAGNMSANHMDTLNFVKFTTKVLSLDTSLTNEVSSLRRTLLTQVGLAKGLDCGSLETF